MKVKFHKLLFAAFIALLMLFTACSDEDSSSAINTIYQSKDSCCHAQ